MFFAHPTLLKSGARQTRKKYQKLSKVALQRWLPDGKNEFLKSELLWVRSYFLYKVVTFGHIQHTCLFRGVHKVIGFRGGNTLLARTIQAVVRLQWCYHRGGRTHWLKATAGNRKFFSFPSENNPENIIWVSLVRFLSCSPCSASEWTSDLLEISYVYTEALGCVVPLMHCVVTLTTGQRPECTSGVFCFLWQLHRL